MRSASLATRALKLLHRQDHSPPGPQHLTDNTQHTPNREYCRPADSTNRLTYEYRTLRKPGQRQCNWA